MKILAGALITENLTAHLLNRRETLGPAADLNGLRHLLADLPWIPAGDWTDFGRGSRAVRQLMLAAALAAGDFGTPPEKETGIIGWNGCGCTAENLRFWRDYVQNGRVNGRGSLFVATLPTIPFCEAAIAFGWQGPSAYFRTENSTDALFRLLANRPEGKYLIGEIAEKSVCCLLAETGPASPALPDLTTLEELFVCLEKRP